MDLGLKWSKPWRMEGMDMFPSLSRMNWSIATELSLELKTFIQFKKRIKMLKYIFFVYFLCYQYLTVIEISCEVIVPCTLQFWLKTVKSVNWHFNYHSTIKSEFFIKKVVKLLVVNWYNWQKISVKYVANNLKTP